MIPGIIESARSVAPFTDTFNRTNAADIATIEYEWLELSGDWQINSNTAFTPTAASSYPLAVFDAQKENASVRAHSSGNNNSGYGVAFWAIDANNWWAAVTDSSTSTGSVTTYSCPNGGTLSGTTCLKTCTSGGQFLGYTGGTCPANQSVTPDSNCTCNDPGGCGCYSYEVGDYGSCTCYSGLISDYQGVPCSTPYLCNEYCNGYWFSGCYTSARSGVVPPYTYPGSGCVAYYSETSSYNCDYAATASTTTTTVYTHTMKILKRESGTVTQVASSNFYSGGTDFYLSNIAVTTNGASITVTGVNGGTSVAFNHTASNPTIGTKHGIVIAPAARSQSTRIDQFDYIN